MGRTRDIHVNERFCKGCGICVAVCPKQAIEMSDQLSQRGVYAPRIADLERCIACRMCELHCPDFAIAIEPSSEKEPANA